MAANEAIRVSKGRAARRTEHPQHWIDGSALATHLVNGVNMLFPDGERFFIRSVKHYLDQITDESSKPEPSSAKRGPTATPTRRPSTSCSGKATRSTAG